MKKNQKKLLIIVVLIVIAFIIGADNLEYILSGKDIETVVYRAGQVITSGDSKNEDANEKVEYNSEEFDDLKVYVFNVGQADAILIMNDEETMLIDAGNNPDGKLIVEQLKNMNISKLNYVIGTHAHEDHIGGLDNVLNNFDVDNFMMPKKVTTTKTYEDVLKAAKSSNLKITAPKIGDTFNFGNAKCEVMNIDNDAEDLNETSIVIELTYGNNKFLFTGDTETTKEKERNWNDIDLLKVAHHGSSSSTSKAFLEQTKPEYAIISCGVDNDYGHPHKEVVNRLKDIETHRTDKEGTILITSDGNKISIENLDINLDGNSDK